jgi:hypothetical protein
MPSLLTLLVWVRTWYAPCEADTEWRAIQVKRYTNDRLTFVKPPVTKNGKAMRAEVRDGDVAWNPKANNGLGAEIAGGWRAEVVGPNETASTNPVRYTWSTMFDASYPLKPVSTETSSSGQAVWQVVTQWHQGDNDTGGPPPVAFIVANDEIRLHIHRHDPNDEQKSIEVAQWKVAPSLDRGQWHDFVLEIRWSTTNGTLKLWHNGTPVTFSQPSGSTQELSGLETLFPPKQRSLDPPSAYIKMGLYRRPVASTAGGPFIVFHDEVSRDALSQVRWRIPRIIVRPLDIPWLWFKKKPKPWPGPWPPWRRPVHPDHR